MTFHWHMHRSPFDSVGSVRIHLEKNICSNCVNCNRLIVLFKNSSQWDLPWLGGQHWHLLCSRLPKEYPFVSHFIFWDLLKLCYTVAPKEVNIKQNIQLLIFQGSNEPSAHLFFEVLPDCQEEISFHSLSFPYVKTMLSVLYNIMYNSLVYIFIFYSKLSHSHLSHVRKAGVVPYSSDNS